MENEFPKRKEIPPWSPPLEMRGSLFLLFYIASKWKMNFLRGRKSLPKEPSTRDEGDLSFFFSIEPANGK